MQSQEIKAEILGKHHPEYATGLNNLAELYSEKGKYKLAEELFLQAKYIDSAATGIVHPNYALDLNNLAQLYKDIGQNKKAETLYLEANKIRYQLFGNEHPDYAAGLLAIANLHVKTGELDLAYHFCIKGLDANCKGIDSNFNFSDLRNLHHYEYYSMPFANELMVTLLIILKQQYEKEGSNKILHQRYLAVKAAIQLNKKTCKDLFNKEDKLRALEINNIFVQHGIETSILLKKEPYIREAFRYSELNKSVLLTDAIKSYRAGKSENLPDSIVQYDNYLQNQLSQLQKKETLIKNKEERKEFISKMADLELKINVFENHIKTAYPQYYISKNLDITASCKEIQNLLDAESVLLEYFMTDSIVYLFSISKEKIVVYPLSV